jgi:PPOX class probable F420-dependent enzyme
MDEEVMRRRVAGARVGHLATTTADGRAHVVPCCFVLSGQTLYSAVDAKPKSTNRLQRIRNLEANPSAALVVDHYEEDWARLWWVRVDGRGRVADSTAERDVALELLAAKYAQYAHERPPGPVIALDIHGWRAWP